MRGRDGDTRFCRRNLQKKLKNATYFPTKTSFLKNLCPNITRERILNTIKQLNNYIWTYRKQVKFCFYLPIGPNKIFNCLVLLIVSQIRSLSVQIFGNLCPSKAMKKKQRNKLNNLIMFMITCHCRRHKKNNKN